MSLIEREAMRRQLDDLLAEAAGGTGVVAVIGGPTATGKTALLRELAERAEAAGIVVLRATSSGDERDRPFGTLGQLIDLDDVAPAAAAPHPALALAGRLHTVVADLAERATVLITVDDLQHTDEESLRCLRHLAYRLTSHRVAIVLAWEDLVGDDHSPTLRELIYRPSVRWLHLRTLSPAGVGELVRERHGADRAVEKAAVYHSLTGGNPLLTSALLRDNPRTDDGGPPSVRSVAAGPAYAQAVLVCLHRMGPLATRVARDFALLDDPVDPHLVSRLSGVDDGLVRRAVRYLTVTGIMDGVRFRHPAARQAILDGVPAEEEVRLRRRAAFLLHDEGAPAAAIARQLLVAGPLREDWVPPVLEEAASQALKHNDVSRAVRCLQIAGESCSSEVERYSIKARLAALRWLVRPATSVSSFTTLRVPILADKVRPLWAQEVAQALLWYLRFDEATEVIEHMAGRPADIPCTDVKAEVTRLTLETMFPGVARHLHRPPAADATDAADARGDAGPADGADAPGGARPPSMVAPELRSLEILRAVLRQSADEHTIARAEQVLQGDNSRVGSLMAIGPAILSLVYTDRLESAAAWCDRFLADAAAPDGSDGKSGAWRAFLDGFGALTALRMGDLDAAAERARRTFDQIGRNGWNGTSVLALAVLAEARTAMGDHAAAAELFADPAPAAVFKTTSGLHYLYARGRHHLAAERDHAALADFMACGEHMTRWNIDSPGLVPWRVGAAEAWLRLGDRDSAADLVAEQLAQLRTELPRTQGMTLRCLAAVSPLEKRSAILERAVKPLERSGARYELARVLVDLGETYHKLGDRTRAQTATRRARRLAKSCNAQDLYDEAPAPSVRVEGSGMVPLQYSDAYAGLSGSERRVALLAARGFTNREIAGRLFVTVSTVEQHLTRVYRKLKVRNREELPTVLRTDDVEAV